MTLKRSPCNTCDVHILSPQVFKYNTSMEKHKIFISGLPFSCTKEQLEEICKSHGTVKEVRLVTYRSGKPKVRGGVEDRVQMFG